MINVINHKVDSTKAILLQWGRVRLRCYSKFWIQFPNLLYSGTPRKNNPWNCCCVEIQIQMRLYMVFDPHWLDCVVCLINSNKTWHELCIAWCKLTQFGEIAKVSRIDISCGLGWIIELHCSLTRRLWNWIKLPKQNFKIGNSPADHSNQKFYVLNFLSLYLSPEKMT